MIIIFYIKINYLNIKFKKNGYVIVKNVLTKEECDKLWKEILEKWKENKLEAKRPNIEIKKKGLRKDLLMDFQDYNREIFKKITKRFRNFLEKHFGTKNVGINEYSCIISFPNTEYQDFHRDGYENKYKDLIVFGVLLSDVIDEMGPTEIIKGSHKESNNVQKVILDPSNKKNIVKTSGKKGDMVIWEGHVVHRGGENKSNHIRPILIFTFINLDSEFGKRGSKEASAAIYRLYKDKNLNYLLSTG